MALPNDAITCEWEIQVKIDNNEFVSRKAFEVKTAAAAFEAVIITSPVIYQSDKVINMTMYVESNIDHQLKKSGEATIVVKVFKDETEVEPYLLCFHKSYVNK